MPVLGTKLHVPAMRRRLVPRLPAPRRARPATRHRRHIAVAARPRGIPQPGDGIIMGVMASPLAGLPDELAGHQLRQGAPRLVLPNGPGYPRIVQAWLWLKKPTWFLDRCSRAYGDVF